MSAVTSQQELVNLLRIQKERDRQWSASLAEQDAEDKAQEQREKDELKLQVLLIAAGAAGFEVGNNDNIEALYGEETRINFTNAILSMLYEGSWRDTRKQLSVNTMTDYLFSEGVRAIKI